MVMGHETDICGMYVPVCLAIWCLVWSFNGIANSLQQSAMKWQ